MAKAKTSEKTPRHVPGSGGSSIRDKVTGELRPNLPTTEPAAESVQEVA